VTNGPPTTVVCVDPNLRLPYTWPWNAAAAPSITGGSLNTSDSRSAYRALQVQFQRRLSNGLPALASCHGRTRKTPSPTISM
jgi:hypothetical protein